MKSIAARSTGLIVAVILTFFAAGSRAQTSGGPGAGAGVRPVASWTTPDGTVQIIPAAGWELNPRLAEDNRVVGMVHPGGMKKEQTLPAWLLIDRRTRDPKSNFQTVVRACISEGRTFGYLPADSLTIQTADGRPMHTYTFNRGADGSERGLGLLETPIGTLLFRFEASSPETWRTERPAIEAMLRSVRFLPDTKSGK